MPGSETIDLLIFGGSFNPPHRGHVAMANAALTKFPQAELWIVPTYQHAFGKKLMSFEQRLQLCMAAFDCQTNSERIHISSIESQLSGTSYTARTLEEIHRRFPNKKLGLIMGEDSYQSREKWHRFERICELAELVVFKRGAESEIPDISSTEIRAKLARREDISTLVPNAVTQLLSR